MKLNRVENHISLNKIMNMNFINATEKDASKDGKISINGMMSLAQKNSNKCFNEDSYTGGLSIYDVFQYKYKKPYNNFNKKDRINLKELQNNLNKLSSYDPMYKGKRSLIGSYIKEGNWYYYMKDLKSQGYCGAGFNRRYDLGTCNLTLENIKKYKNKHMDYITCTIIALALQNGVICNYKQIKSLFGITEYRLRSTMKKMGIPFFQNRRNATYGEKRRYDYHVKDNLRKTDGMTIYNTDDIKLNNTINNNTLSIIEEIIKDFNIEINWTQLYKIRTFFIRNCRQVKFNVFEDIKEYISYINVKEDLTKEDYFDIINKDEGKQRSLMNRIDCDMNLKKGKKIIEENLYKSYQTKDKCADIRKELEKEDDLHNYVESDNDSTQIEEETISLPDSGNNIESDLPILEFSDFCESVRENFKEYLSRSHYLDSWREYKIHAIEELKNSNLENKEQFITAFESIKRNIDVMTSPLLCENWSNNCDESNMILKMLYHSWDHDLSKQVEKENVSEFDFVGVLNLLHEEIVNDIQNFTKEKYINTIKERCDNKELSKNQIESLDIRIDEYISMKQIWKMKNFGEDWNFKDCLEYSLRDDFDSFDEYMENLNYLIKTYSSGSNIGYLSRTIKRFLTEKNFTHIKKNLSSDNKKSKIILDYMEEKENEVVVKEKPRKSSFDLVEEELIKELAKRGFKKEYSATLKTEIKMMTAKIIMRRLDVVKVADNYSKGIYID